MPKGIYIHIPFCQRKCPYCDFYSVVSDEKLRHSYIDKLIVNIKNSNEKGLFDTVYFGGGTPSLIEPCDIARVISALYETFDFLSDCEITMEANPNSVTLERLKGYKEAGVNRISFGVQSAHDNELLALGRLHNFSEAENSVMMARSAGFENISCDLMLGTPHQTLDSLKDSIHKLCSLEIPHISAYMLKIEEGTAYDCEAIKNCVADEDTLSDMYLLMCNELESLGYGQYEISNFAKDGKASRHNLKYWTGEDYLGFGPSAHSLKNGKRFYVESDFKKYLESDLQTELIEDDSPDKLEEYMMLSLRLSTGLDYKKLSSLGGNEKALKESCKKFLKVGLIKETESGIRLTKEGFLVSNGIIYELIESQF